VPCVALERGPRCSPLSPAGSLASILDWSAAWLIRERRRLPRERSALSTTSAPDRRCPADCGRARPPCTCGRCGMTVLRQVCQLAQNRNCCVTSLMMHSASVLGQGSRMINSGEPEDVILTSDMAEPRLAFGARRWRRARSLTLRPSGSGAARPQAQSQVYLCPESEADRGNPDPSSDSEIRP
jgi:hypothetical protein